MKLLLIISLFVSNISYAEEEKLVVSTAKQKEIEGELKKNEELQACKELSDEADQDKCISDLVSSMDDKALEAIAKDLGGSAFEVDGGAKAESIKKFMQERISKIIYGDKKKKKGDPAQVVGHGTYREIYKSQLGKNMFLDINTYCLENLGIEKDSPTKMISKIKLSSDNKSVERIYVTDYKDPNNLEVEDFAPSDFWKSKVEEYSKGKKGEDYKRSSDQLKQLKKISIDRYANEPQEAKIVQSFCTNKAIKNLCEIYKCNQQYKSLTDDNQTMCKEEFSVSKEDKSVKKGQIACSLLKRLESYKITLEELDKQNDYFKTAEKSVGFGGVVKAIDTEYSDIDEMTSISSRELTNEADAIKNSVANAEELDEKCKVDALSDKDCAKIVSGINDDQEKSINLDTKIANEVYKQRIEKLAKSGDKEEFKKFLEDNNLLSKYGKQLENLEPSELATIISNDYTAKKNALKEEMMNKFKSLTQKEATGEEKVVDAKFKDKIEEVKEDKEYIETMFEYNNIVTSYLDLQLESEKDGKTVRENIGSFNQNRKNELKAMEKYAKSDAQAMEDYQKYQQMFNDEDSNQSDSGKSADDINFLGFIDNVLGVD